MNQHIFRVAAIALCSALILIGCSQANEPNAVDQTTQVSDGTAATPTTSTDTEVSKTTTESAEKIMGKNPIALLKTSKGDIKIELNGEKAPLSVANFIEYAQAGHYDGTLFHRVIPGFMIQGGGFVPGMQQKPTNTPVQNEANNGLSNETYTIAMARTSAPHSATSQFFINVTNNDRLDFTSESGAGWGYAVFGKVVEGEEVVKAIEAVATGQVGPYGDVPQEDVLIESVTLSE